MDDASERNPAGLVASLRRHPVLTGTIVGCALLGALLGFALLTQEWSALRRIAAGAVAGASAGFLITATKMFG